MRAYRTRAYHLDTCILIPMFYENSRRQRDVKNILNTLYKHRNDPGTVFRISHIALGELLDHLMKENPNIEVQEINSKLRHYNIELFKPTYAPAQLLNIASKIAAQDNRISINDLLIVSAALLDKECTGLITTDSTLILNKAILKISATIGKPNFQITENPFRRR